LDLLSVAFLLVEFGTKASEFLGIVGLFVGFSGDALSSALFMIESVVMVSAGTVKVWRNVRTSSHVASATAQYTRFEAAKKFDVSFVNASREL